MIIKYKRKGTLTDVAAVCREGSQLLENGGSSQAPVDNASPLLLFHSSRQQVYKSFLLVQ